MNTLKEQKSKLNKQNIDDAICECEKYREKLIEYCKLHFEDDYEGACDCVQSAYLALYENLHRGIEIRNYQAWLYKVTMNYRNKAMRDIIKRNELIFLSNENKDQVLENSLVYDPDYIENMVSDFEIERRYNSVISSLSEDEKLLYTDHYLKKKTLVAISKNLGVKVSVIQRKHVKLKKKIIDLVKSYNNME